MSKSRAADATEESQHLLRAPLEEEADLRCLSVRQAVNFAKSTNLLGVILEATTLVSPLPLHYTMASSVCKGCEFGPETHVQAAVPSLVASVKDAGLLLAAFGPSGELSSLRAGASDGRTVDAFVVDG